MYNTLMVADKRPASSAGDARYRVAVIGAGPSGLMAAETLSEAGIGVDVFDAMPSAARKFLMAGKGGMNLTHSEPYDHFLSRYGASAPLLAPFIDAFSPQALRHWSAALGIDTFVGTSGRVFPTDMKAAPLLRAWLHKLRSAGVRFHMRHRWVGWETTGASPAGEAGASTFPDERLAPAAPYYTLLFDSDRERENTRSPVRAGAFGAVVLALGGASWPRLGSDARWVPNLRRAGVSVVDFEAANVGFECDWSTFMRERFAGTPLKNIAIAVGAKEADVAQDAMQAADAAPAQGFRQGECMLTEQGIEGGLIYALSSTLRARLNHRDSEPGVDNNCLSPSTRDQQGERGTWIYLDLLPAMSAARVQRALSQGRGKRSLGTHLHAALGLRGAKTALLHECLPAAAIDDPMQLARAIKALPLRLLRTRPIAEAISSDGGVTFDAVNRHLMLHALPGVFCAGEMLDWDAPTGGYLLTACLATGKAAGAGARDYVRSGYADPDVAGAPDAPL